MSFENTKQTIFTGTELDYEEIVEIPEGYEKAELKDFEDGTLITGRPEMASVTSFNSAFSYPSGISTISS